MVIREMVDVKRCSNVGAPDPCYTQLSSIIGQLILECEVTRYDDILYSEA
jgi:hypothetical protein